MKDRITPEGITELKDNEIFVFGSNEAGNHGAGAAYQAYVFFGARNRQGFGPRFETFAIPTKDWRIRTLPLDVIGFYVKRFIEYVKSENWTKKQNKEVFLVTEIGCGLAGYTPEQIAPLFKNAVEVYNIHLPQRFWDVLNK